MKATLIGHTTFKTTNALHCTTGWLPDISDAQALVEFAGRACYQSWTKPNPATAMNKTYLANIIKQRHFSTFEHASATFYITGVSRSLTHELIRHRHLSYSELSQRYVDVEEAAWIVPPAIGLDDRSKMGRLIGVGQIVKEAYRALADQLMAEGSTRKEARQAARAVMPNMTETRIVVTGNVRAWRHFIEMRATTEADAEIRRAAVEIAWQLKGLWPNLFQDMNLRTGAGGNDTIYFGPREEDE